MPHDGLLGAPMSTAISRRRLHQHLARQSAMTDKSMTGLTLHKCALALAAILIATPALDAAPDSTAGDEPQSGSERWLQAAQQEQSSQTVGTLRPPAKAPSTTNAKLEQPATTSVKHAMPATTSKVAKSKTPNSKLGVSNHSNAN